MKGLKLAGTLVLWFILGCKDVVYPDAASALKKDKLACISAGNIIKAQADMAGEPCWMAQLKLSEMVRTNPDCRALGWDGGVDLCAAEVADGGGPDGD